MKVKRYMTAALGVTLATLGYLARPAAASEAALWCYQLTNCTGQAGCTQGGDLNGCTIDCYLGGTAECTPREAD